MSSIRDSIVQWAVGAFHHDPARPIELMSLLSLVGWLQFLLTEPELFAHPRYVAFAALPAPGWATIIAAIVIAQLVALWPWRHSSTLRWIAMAAATGMWTVIALSFWSVETAPIAARTNTVIAIVSFVTAIHLGLRRER